jgi:hypothetical protein
MLHDPEHHRLPHFAGHRVRMIDVIVELHDRTPIRIVRLVYGMLRFDSQGIFDHSAFYRQNTPLWGLDEGELTTKDKTVVDASGYFIVRGGRWRPSPSMERLVFQAALDEVKCPRL